MAAPGARREPGGARRGRRRCPAGLPPGPPRLEVPGKVGRPESRKDAAATSTSTPQSEVRRKEQKPGERAHGPPAPLHLTRISPPSPRPSPRPQQRHLSQTQRARCRKAPGRGRGRACRLPGVSRPKLGSGGWGFRPLRGRRPRGLKPKRADSLAWGLSTPTLSRHPAWVVTASTSGALPPPTRSGSGVERKAFRKKGFLSHLPLHLRNKQKAALLKVDQKQARASSQPVLRGPPLREGPDPPRPAVPSASQLPKNHTQCSVPFFSQGLRF